MGVVFYFHNSDAQRAPTEVTPALFPGNCRANIGLVEILAFE